MNRGTQLLLVAAAAAAGVGASLVARHRPGGSMPIRHDGEYVTIRAVTVDRPVDSVWELVRDPDQLSAAFDRPVTAEPLGEGRARYLLGDPAGAGGQPVGVIVEVAGRVARWRVESGPLAHEGRLTLVAAPGDRGTELRVELRYPEGRLRHQAAVLRGRDPDQRLRTVLRRVKSMIECGQVVATMAEPSARSGTAERATRVVREKLATGGRP
ncbi:cyclase [Micromonospora sp. NBC_01655]|uniref:SRPBCC family protein n=1 Tax=Micromonospora sp. NBC_01655 TaxID=2975983 RepID=UPI002250B958|nr:cyclase [Micromonospora sp. NBC_01655]MCX4471630.1 cyclase [Micromonospora sp. NBC_01655]